MFFFFNLEIMFPEVATDFKLEKYVQINRPKSHIYLQEVAPVGVPPFY